jgi:hypothetical protein
VKAPISPRRASGGRPAIVAIKLSLWRDNDSALRTTAARSFAVGEILPVSEDLSLLSATALDALDYRAHLKRGQSWPCLQSIPLGDTATDGSSKRSSFERSTIRAVTLVSLLLRRVTRTNVS